MNEPPGEDVILYQRDGVPVIDVRLVSDTVTLSLNQLADLQLLRILQQLPPIAKPSEVEAAYLKTVKTVHKKIANRKKS